MLITAAILLVFSIPAQARHHHHYHSYHHHHHYAHASHHRGTARTAERGGGGIVTVATAAGRITVASHLAERFKALIADFVSAGYKPRHIGCFANGGHVPNSRHYHGAACDFDQTGWGRTVRFMYHAREIIRKHGFRDGCTFSDCGHVDDGKPVHYGRRYWNSDFGG
jgi:hypothetical protein